MYTIKHVSDGYIIHNTDKSFEDGHTHIEHYRTALYLISLLENNKLPHHLPKYLLISLKRLSTDNSYICKIDDLLEAKSKVKSRYYNPHKKRF